MTVLAIANDIEKKLSRLEYQSRLNAIKEKLNKDDKDIEYLYHLAMTHIELDNIQEARNTINVMEDVNSESLYILLLQSALNRVNENLKEALRITNEVISENPFLSNAYFERAQIYLDAGQIEKAESDIDKGLSFDEKNIEYINILSLIKKYQGEEEASIHLLEKAVSLDHNDPHVLNRLAYAYYDSGKSEQASETFEKVLSIAPQNELAKNGLRKSIKSKYVWHYQLKNKMQNLPGRFQSSQLIIVGLIMVFAIFIILQLLQNSFITLWILRAFSILLSIVIVILIYQDMLLDFFMLKNSKFSNALSKSQRLYIYTSIILVFGGLLTTIFGTFMMNMASITTIGCVLLILPFFIKFLFYREMSMWWSVIKLGLFILLSILAVNISSEQAIIFNPGFIWLLILGLVEVWIQFMNKNYK